MTYDNMFNCGENKKFFDNQKSITGIINFISNKNYVYLLLYSSMKEGLK